MKEKWSALTDSDLEGIAGRQEPLADKLQERYGYGKEQAEREADEFLRSRNESYRDPMPPAAQPVPTPVLQSASVKAEVAPPPSYAPHQPAPAVSTEQAVVQPAPAVSTAPVGYKHSCTLWISPRLLQWVVPITVAALVILLFLPWAGAYPGGYGVYTQNAFQAISGGVSVDPVGAKALDSIKPFESVEANGLMLLYVILVLFALVLVVGPLWFTAERVQTAPPFVRFLSRGRLEVLGAVALLALTVLIVQSSKGFGLETAVETKVDKALASELAVAKTPEEQATVNIRRAAAMGPFNVGQTVWHCLAVTCQVLLVVGIGLQLWLKRRGSRPLPKIEAHA